MTGHICLMQHSVRVGPSPIAECLTVRTGICAYVHAHCGVPSELEVDPDKYALSMPKHAMLHRYYTHLAVSK